MGTSTFLAGWPVSQDQDDHEAEITSEELPVPSGRVGRKAAALTILLLFGSVALGYTSRVGSLSAASVATDTEGLALEPGTQSSTPSKYWLFCPTPGNCLWFGKFGSFNILQRLASDPKSLIGIVDDGVSTLPGIPQEVWEPVRSRWLDKPPKLWGRPVTLQDLAIFMRGTLDSDPFNTGQAVPFLDFRADNTQKVVAINQRQLAFIVINALLGNSLAHVETGLAAALKRCNKPAAPGISPDQLYSLLSLLAVLSRELGPGEDGTYLVALTPGPAEQDWRALLQKRQVNRPNLCYSGSCDLPDFMSGGAPFQALTDIAGMGVGGGARLCHVANSQDESLVIFYSEVLAFSFFVAEGGMLPVPMSILGARRYVNFISGQSSSGPPLYNSCGKVSETDWINEGIMQKSLIANVSYTPVSIKASSFVAVASECSDCNRGSCSERDMANNLCDAQRRHVDQDISRWLQAFDAANYHSAAADAFYRTVKRIGTGPWGAGLWQGDSQQYFMTVWLATSLLKDVQLDYYIYDHFCESPGHQCFLLAGAQCAKCIASSGMSAVVLADRCGATGAEDIVKMLLGSQAKRVYLLLRDIAAPPRQVLDLIASEAGHRSLSTS
eukprot:TRINITY_DN2015_c0_g2_i1.p1 TRINITY_DN2015_c0_g2~~TRINITY_DN2015_c0_g2_i1.p1  ORF type:complete len:626 (-),score=101.19 TRINITY_DN2015_c0_g2_i1:10-1842(-)